MGGGVRQVRGALSGRKRRPNVSQDFPLVICAELEAVEEAKQRLVKCLQAVTGVAPPQAPVSPQDDVHPYEDWSKKSHLKMNEVLGPISSGLIRPSLMPPCAGRRRIRCLFLILWSRARRRRWCGPSQGTIRRPITPSPYKTRGSVRPPLNERLCVYIICLCDGMLISVGGMLAVFEGPLGVSVDESDRGNSFQMYFERGRYQRADAPLDSLQVLGKDHTLAWPSVVLLSTLPCMWPLRSRQPGGGPGNVWPDPYDSTSCPVMMILDGDVVTP